MVLKGEESNKWLATLPTTSSKVYSVSDFAPNGYDTRNDSDKINTDKENDYFEFVLISVASRTDAQYIQNYPARGLTFAKLTDLQKRRLCNAYKNLSDGVKETILTNFKDPIQLQQADHVKNIKKVGYNTWASAFVQFIAFCMGVGGSIILVIMAFNDSLEHDLYDRLNKASAILLLLFTTIGAFKDLLKSISEFNKGYFTIFFTFFDVEDENDK
jgi:hypothetical protein